MPLPYGVFYGSSQAVLRGLAHGTPHGNSRCGKFNGAYVYLRLSLHYIAYTNLARTIGSYEMLLRSKALPRWYDLEAYRVVVLARVLPGRGDLDS